jgi:sulfite exporter TauE/SafE
MNYDLNILLVTAASIAFIHTLFGPDHYIPFIVMAKSGNWSKNKTIWVTILCGAGHVLSSILLGIVGIAFGSAVSELEVLDSIRGNAAAWLLIAFGFLYFIYGMKKAFINKPHRHIHVDEQGKINIHVHSHEGKHTHFEENRKKNLTPWVLFTIFVLGPCEPLIPLLMYPAATNSNIGLVSVAATFGLITILTMISIVLVSIWGISLFPVKKIEKYSHAIAGAAICLSGLSITLLGL